MVGDLHGNLAALHENLLSLGLVRVNDASDLEWIGGNAHLVLLGDILADRDNQSFDIIEAIAKIRGEAAQVGGHITVIAGNHDDVAATFLMGNELHPYVPEGETPDPRFIPFRNPITYCMHPSNNSIGLTEFRGFLADDKKAQVKIDQKLSWLNLARYRAEILEEMRKDPKGQKILEHICNMQLISTVDDSLFLHTNPTEDIIKALLAGVSNRAQLDEKIASINQRYQNGLRKSLLEGQDINTVDPSFAEFKSLFLDTDNRKDFTQEETAKALKECGINAIFHGHTSAVASGGIETTKKAGLLTVKVDRSAYLLGQFTDRRSIASIHQDSGKITYGEANQVVRDGKLVITEPPPPTSAAPNP